MNTNEQLIAILRKERDSLKRKLDNRDKKLAEKDAEIEALKKELAKAMDNSYVEKLLDVIDALIGELEKLKEE